jgi:hypothetical protein
MPTGDPPSLRRRAPARLDITLRSGRCPRMNRRRVHLRAGRTLFVQVVPQNPAAKVEITSEDPLIVVVPASRVDGGPAPTYHAEYTGRSRLRVLPLPVSGRLHVSLADGHPNPFRVTIPVTVWPSAWTLLLWWVVAYFTIVGTRWQGAVAHSRSVWEVFPLLWGDLPFLIELMLLGVLVIVPLRLLGALVAMAEPGDGDQ